MNRTFLSDWGHAAEVRRAHVRPSLFQRFVPTWTLSPSRSRHQSKCSLIWDSTTSLWQTGQLTVWLCRDELLQFCAAAAGWELPWGSSPPTCACSFLIKKSSKTVLSPSLRRLLGASRSGPLAPWDAVAEAEPTAFKEFLSDTLEAEALWELDETGFLLTSPTVRLCVGDPFTLLEVFWLRSDTLGK